MSELTIKINYNEENQKYSIEDTNGIEGIITKDRIDVENKVVDIVDSFTYKIWSENNVKPLNKQFLDDIDRIVNNK